MSLRRYLALRPKWHSQPGYSSSSPCKKIRANVKVLSLSVSTVPDWRVRRSRYKARSPEHAVHPIPVCSLPSLGTLPTTCCASLNAIDCSCYGLDQQFLFLSYDEHVHHILDLSFSLHYSSLIYSINFGEVCCQHPSRKGSFFSAAHQVHLPYLAPWLPGSLIVEVYFFPVRNRTSTLEHPSSFSSV